MTLRSKRGAPLAMPRAEVERRLMALWRQLLGEPVHPKEYQAHPAPKRRH